MKKRAIPSPTDTNRRMFDEAVKENLEVIMGVRGGRMKPLPATASFEDVIAKVNEILEKLQ